MIPQNVKHLTLKLLIFNSSNSHENSECETNKSDIETSDSNSSDCHDPSECEIKEPDVETSDSIYY